MPALQHPNGGAVLAQQAVVNGVGAVAAMGGHNFFQLRQIGAVHHVLQLAARGVQHFRHAVVARQLIQRFVNVNGGEALFHQAAF